MTLLGAQPRFQRGWQQVATGVMAYLQPNGDWGESNAGAVFAGDECLIIDTLYDEVLTGRMLAELPARSTALVNTHGDFDHVGGNALLKGKPSYATAAAIHQVKRDLPQTLALLSAATEVAVQTSSLAGQVAQSSGSLKRLSETPIAKAAAKGAARLPGQGVSAVNAGPAYVHRMLSPFSLRKASHCPANEEVVGKKTIGVGGRAVELIEIGAAHSPGDLIVSVPDARVVFAGDLMFSGVTPISWSGPVSSLLGGLQTIRNYNPITVVPGHGPLCDLSDVRLNEDYWRWVDEVATANSQKPGGRKRSLFDVSKALLLSGEFAGLPWGQWDSAERILVNLMMVQRSSEGQPMHVTSAQKLKILFDLGRLHAATVALA